jgi:hypothetical protein
MKLRSVVLVAFALLLFGTPARADTVVFTPGSLGVDFSLNDNLGFYVTSAGIAMEGELASISGSDFVLSATDTPYSDAGIVLFFNGGLIVEHLQSVTVATTNPGAVSVNLWLDTGGDGQFFAFDGSGLLTGLNGDSYGNFGITTHVTGTTPYERLGGSVASTTLAGLQAAYPTTAAALWIGITNTNTADISSVTVDVTPEPASWPPMGIGLVAFGAILALRSGCGRRPKPAAARA